MTGETILAVAPGTRELGVAVLGRDLLRYYGVKNIDPKVRKLLGPPAAAVRMIERMLNQHRPDALIIRQPLIVHSNFLILALVIRELKELAVRRGITVEAFAPKVIRKTVCGDDRSTNRDLARVLIQRFPDLARHFHEQSRWQRLYYDRLFEAVAAGLTYQLTHGAASLDQRR